jgi:prepilin-type N-terminal cleavage/methylation domain-containing protein
VTRERSQGGFTLVETMIALAILAIGLGMMLRSTASNIFAAQRAQMMTSAVNLARGKMYDIEETLITDGFPEMDQSEEGTFSDEGWAQISWKSEIVKIELPDMSTLQGMSGQEGAEGAEGAAPAAPAAGGLLGGMLGGVGGTDPNSVAGAGIMGTYYTLISDVLKDAIRKVTLTVSYDVGGDHESMVVTCYFTDPGAIARKIPGVGGMAGGQAGEEGGGEEGGGTPNPNPNPTPSPSPKFGPNPTRGGTGETR